MAQEALDAAASKECDNVALKRGGKTLEGQIGSRLGDLTVWPPELLLPQSAAYAAPGGSTSVPRADANPDFMLNLLGSFLTGFVQALFNPDRHEQQSFFNFLDALIVLFQFFFISS